MRHVVEDIEVDRQQVFQGKQCAIDGGAVHVSHQTDVVGRKNSIGVARYLRETANNRRESALFSTSPPARQL